MNERTRETLEAIDPDFRAMREGSIGLDEVSIVVVHGQAIMVLEYNGDDGFEVFVPPTKSNSIADTVAAARRILEAQDA